jgi:hypothetical protein
VHYFLGLVAIMKSRVKTSRIRKMCPKIMGGASTSSNMIHEYDGFHLLLLKLIWLTCQPKPFMLCSSWHLFNCILVFFTPQIFKKINSNSNSTYPIYLSCCYNKKLYDVAVVAYFMYFFHVSYLKQIINKEKIT